MAEPQKVIVQSNRIDTTILPPGFTLAYKLYVIQQTTDMQNIADASNNANDLAYQATIRNQEQDLILDDHEGRIVSLRLEVDDHEIRIIANGEEIGALNTRLESAEGAISSQEVRLSSAEGVITSLQGDYVSKSASESQSLSSAINIQTSLSVNGTKVVGARQTGFTAATGAANKGGFNADTSYSVSATYTQSQVQAIANDLRATRQRVKALEDALRAHGLIN
ncbi:phage tail protein [Erwinia sp. P6884]|uniref:phage tail protein n=1 Tax=Erwinia sp. P6884 TaxID=3141450 RepID=UPI00318767BD